MKSKIQILCLSAALLFSLPILQAQTTSIGLRAGINNATVNIEDPSGLSVEPDSRIGIDIAAVLNFGVTEVFSIQPELHFLQKGFKFELDFLGETLESNTILNYLEIPILDWSAA